MRGMLPAGQSLDKVLSPETLAAVLKKFAELGIPAAPLKQFKPWLLSLTLQALEWQKAGFDTDLGLDKHFYDLAKAAGQTRSRSGDAGVSEFRASRDVDAAAGPHARRNPEGTRDDQDELHAVWPTPGRPATRRRSKA